MSFNSTYPSKFKRYFFAGSAWYFGASFMLYCFIYGITLFSRTWIEFFDLYVMHVVITVFLSALTIKISYGVLPKWGGLIRTRKATRVACRGLLSILASNWIILSVCLVVSSRMRASGPRDMLLLLVLNGVLMHLCFFGFAYSLFGTWSTKSLRGLRWYRNPIPLVGQLIAGSKKRRLRAGRGERVPAKQSTVLGRKGNSSSPADR